MSDEPTPKTTIEIPIVEYNELKGLKTKVSEYEQRLLDGNSAFETLQSEFEELRKSKTKGPSREEIEATVRREYGDQIEALKTRANELTSTLKGRIVTDKVMGLLREKGLLPHAEEYIKRDVETLCDLDSEDFATANIVVKDQQGNVRWSAKRAGERMDITELAEEFVHTKAPFFAADTRPGVGTTNGGGANGVTRGHKPTTLAEFNRLSPEEQSKLDVATLNEIMSTIRMG